MIDGWYYSRNGQQQGPYSLEQMQQMFRNRQLTGNDLVWRNGLSGWQAAVTVAGLMPQDKLDSDKTSIGTLPPPLPPGKAAIQAQLDTDKTSLGFVETPVPAQTPMPASTPAPSSSTTSSPGTLRIGQTLDRYLLSARLGSGGMGVVYKATNLETENECALKVLAPELVADPAALQILRKEFANAETLAHQHLLKINSLVTSGQTAYIVMEFIDGENLEAYRTRKGTIGAEDFRKLAPQILLGLDYLHEKGVIHRDIKPQNIMITKSGEVKIADYGIAQSIKDQMNARKHAQAPAGTLHYMSPEQLRGDSTIDRRSDIYAVGMMFHRLLTGRFPFDENNRDAIAKWHLDPRHKIAGVSLPGAADVIRKALSVDPAARHGSCKEMLHTLATVGLVDPVHAEAPKETTADNLPLPPTTFVEDIIHSGGLATGTLVVSAVAFALAFAVNSVVGSWLCGAVGWLVKAVVICLLCIAAAPAITALVLRRKTKPEDLGAAAVIGGVVGIVLTLLLSWFVRGIWSGLTFSFILASAAAGTLTGFRKNWFLTAPNCAAIGIGLLGLLIAFFLVKSPTGDENDERIYGDWVQEGGRIGGPQHIQFTKGGSVVLKSSFGDRVGSYTCTGTTLKIQVKDDFTSKTVTYKIDFVSQDEFVLDKSGTYSTAFYDLEGKWKRDSGGGSGKRSSKGDVPDFKGGSGGPVAPPRIP